MSLKTTRSILQTAERDTSTHLFLSNLLLAAVYSLIYHCKEPDEIVEIKVPFATSIYSKMGSNGTPLKRHKSVKFHIEERKTKPSIKITVSSDALAETILANSITSSSTPTTSNDCEDDGALNNCHQQQQQKPSLIQIRGNCCTPSNGSGNNSSPPNGVLCNCASGDENRTRIALDDFTVLEFPNCIDFGIKDFLCCKDEIELDLSSDNDASFLDATPPHRFSDSELENTIEAMSITLDSTLNPFPNRNPFLFRSSKNSIPGEDEDDEEETTEESFIMDEEEGSSSASNNSAATICGGTMDVGDGDITELEHDENNEDEHPSLSDGIVQREPPLELSTENSVITVDDHEENHVQQQSINNADKDGMAQTIGEDNDARAEEGLDLAQHMNVDCANIRDDEIPDLKSTEGDVDRSHSNKGITISPSMEQLNGVRQERKKISHPKKHFKRQISLPASIFMSYLLEQNNKANYCSQQQQIGKKSNFNHSHNQNCDLLDKHNTLNRSKSFNKKPVSKVENGIVLKMRLSKSNKIDEYRSTNKVIQGSTEDFEYEENNSNSVSDHDLNEMGERQSSITEGDDDSLMLGRCKWSWENKTDTIQDPRNENDSHELDDEQAFTSDLEKRSLILRHVRRLIRQDTTGNFAPPDFSI